MQITIESAPTAPMALHIRIPGWAQNVALPGGLYQFSKNDSLPVTLALNGRIDRYETGKWFAVIERQWSGGEVLELNLPMPFAACRRVNNWPKTPGKWRCSAVRSFIVWKVLISRTTKCWTSCCRKMPHSPLSDGTICPAMWPPSASPDNLQQWQQMAKLDASQPVDLTAILIFAWAHRGMSEMAVWLPERSRKNIPKRCAVTGATVAKIVVRRRCQRYCGVEWCARQPASSRDARNGYFAWAERRDTLRVTYEFDTPQPFSASQIYWFVDVANNYQVPENGGCKLLVEGEGIHRF